MASLSPEIEKLIAESKDYEFVTNPRVVCNGNGGALGHPKTYYEIGDRGWVTCGYCDKLFVLRDQ